MKPYDQEGIEGSELIVWNTTDGNIEVSLTPRERREFERMFQLGVNVPEGTSQEITLRVLYIA